MEFPVVTRQRHNERIVDDVIEVVNARNTWAEHVAQDQDKAADDHLNESHLDDRENLVHKFPVELLVGGGHKLG